MDPDKDNANPTILNPSDLPTRRATTTEKPRIDGGTGLFDSLIPAPSALNSPFFALYQDSSDDASMSSSSRADAPLKEPSTPNSSASTDAEPIDAQEIYDLIAPISDPEHPLSLGSLSVVNLSDIHILAPPTPLSPISTVTVKITPTITHCSLATVIGLGIRVRLERALPPRFRIDVSVKEGTHSTGEAVSKQLGDKERVAAALENGTLAGVVERMLSTCG
ncbi:MAG: hypothetical protein M1828_005416 [Chrysothrix sp. TS-e1954]|nr:MAG: hypothetical protein M1828_005416 [Chrysothrix sp. TS-e1954]